MQLWLYFVLIKNKCFGLFLMITMVNVTFSEVNLQNINIAKLLQFLKIVEKDIVELNSAGTSCRANLPEQTHGETVSRFRHDEVVAHVWLCLNLKLGLWSGDTRWWMLGTTSCR